MSMSKAAPVLNIIAEPGLNSTKVAPDSPDPFLTKVFTLGWPRLELFSHSDSFSDPFPDSFPDSVLTPSCLLRSMLLPLVLIASRRLGYTLPGDWTKGPSGSEFKPGVAIGTALHWYHAVHPMILHQGGKAEKPSLLASPKPMTESNHTMTSLLSSSQEEAQVDIEDRSTGIPSEDHAFCRVPTRMPDIPSNIDMATL
jgi:hypothetical protein